MLIALIEFLFTFIFFILAAVIVALVYFWIKLDEFARSLTGAFQSAMNDLRRVSGW